MWGLGKLYHFCNSSVGLKISQNKKSLNFLKVTRAVEREVNNNTGVQGSGVKGHPSGSIWRSGNMWITSHTFLAQPRGVCPGLWGPHVALPSLAHKSPNP